MTCIKKYNKSILSQWSRFLLLSYDSKIRCRFEVIITTKLLTLKVIKDENQFRHKLILDLHLNGFTDTEISNYLNENNILTPKGKKYYLELVSATRRKLRLRNIRKNQSSYEIGKLIFDSNGTLNDYQSRHCS
jgi:DNA-binding GntR family transcriptional regulator